MSENKNADSELAIAGKIENEKNNAQITVRIDDEGKVTNLPEIIIGEIENINKLDIMGTPDGTDPTKVSDDLKKEVLDNIKYIDCGGYGTLAAFSIGKLLYCKFNGNNKVSEVTQQDIAQLPSEYTLNSSIGVYRSVLVNARNTGSLQIDTYGKITLYCPYSYLYGYVIIPIK